MIELVKLPPRQTKRFLLPYGSFDHQYRKYRTDIEYVIQTFYSLMGVSA